MAYNFLSLVNRGLKALNEVPFTSATFLVNNVGFHAEAQDAVNRAIFDIYTEEDNEWPFAWDDVSTTSVIGQSEYTKDATLTAIDWDSFYIKNVPIAVTTITQVSGTATVTTTTSHQLITGDVAVIAGASPDAYNGSKTVTVTGTNTYTFTIDSGTASPATGTITSTAPYKSKKLNYMEYDQYRDTLLIQDANATSYSVPRFVVRKPDNNFILSPRPDRIYTISYEGFVLPDALENYDDVPNIPSAFEQAIVDKAMHYLYMFRDNLEAAQLAQDRYEKNVNKMRRILIPAPNYMRHD